MNEIYTINMLQTASKCLKKYDLLYNKKIRLPDNANFAKTGSRLHSLINYYFKGQNVDKLAGILDENERVLWNNFKNMVPGMPLASEYPFFVRFGDVWLTGRMDAVFFNDGKITIADWKTGNFRHGREESFQTMFYQYAAYVIFLKKAMIYDFSDVSMVYFLLKDGTQLKIDYDEAAFSDFENSFKIILEKIKNGSYNNISHIHCEACEFKNLCKDYLL